MQVGKRPPIRSQEALRTTPSRTPYLLALFFVSGACGLIYEIVWSRLLVLVFGGTTFAITTVLACFMGGLAAGSYLAGRLSHRVANPARMYGILEISIGLYCVAVPLLLDLALPLYQMLARASAGSFFWLTLARALVCGAILVLPTAAMGATLPLLSKALSRTSAEVGGAVARLYGVNTVGAFVGCAGAGFFLLPILGLTGAIWCAAGLNVGAGVLAIVLSRRPLDAPQRAAVERGGPRKRARSRPEPQAERFDPTLLLALYGLSGFAAMAYQVSWTRALILSIGSSTYAFTTIVACFILGLALGSLLIAAVVHRVRRPLRLAGLLELLIGLSALVVAPLFGEMPGLVARILESSKGSFGAALGLEVACVLGLLVVPTLCMGALLPLVCMVYESSVAAGRSDGGAGAEATGSSSAGATVGNVYASNTAGTIVGSLVAGFLLIPAPVVGMQRTILIASGLSGVIGTVLLLGGPGSRARRPLTAVAAVWLIGIVVAAAVPSWSKTVMLSGPYLGRPATDMGEILFYREGVDSTVAVTSVREGRLSLSINGKTDASTSPWDMPTQVLAAHIPAVLKPDATEVCIIGLGSGITAAVALAHPTERVDVVEISGAVVEAARYFSSHNDSALSNPRTALHRADGRNFLLLEERTFDIIISEPSNPWISGISNLYTREFMELARSRLKPGGLHCQWIHAYSMSGEDVASVVRTLAEVFPHLQLWETSLDDYLIIGSGEPILIDVERWYLASQRPALRRLVGEASLNDPMQLAHHYIAERRDLESWLAGGRVLTDDLPHLEFSAPRHLLRQQANVIARSFGEITGEPTLVGGAGLPINQRFLERVQHRRRARTAMEEAARAEPGTVLANQQKLLQVAELAPDDARMCLFLYQTLRAMQQGAPASARPRIADLARRLDERASCLSEMAAAQSPSDLSWPLGSRLAVPSTPEMAEIIEGCDRLYRAGRQDQAIDTMTGAVAKRPNDPIALQRLGSWALEAASADQAIPHLLGLWMMMPDDPEISYLLARAYAIRGDRDRALLLLEGAIAHGFGDLDRLTADGLRAALEGDPRLEGVLERLTSVSAG